MNFVYESESGESFDDPSENELDQLLSDLDGVGNSFAYLTRSDGSYVQVGGGPKNFTVEWRELRHDGTFTHLKASLPGKESDERRITIGGASVSVRADQLLDLSLVQRIFRSFRSGVEAPKSFVWQDITAMFQESN